MGGIIKGNRNEGQKESSLVEYLSQRDEEEYSQESEGTIMRIVVASNHSGKELTAERR